MVREARPVLDRHAPVRARLHPRDRPAVGGQERLRPLPPAIAQQLSARRGPISGSARTWSACRCSTTPPARRRSPAGVVRTGASGDGRPSPARRCRSSRSSSGTTPRSRTSWPAVGPLADTLGFTVKNVTYRLDEEVAHLAGKERRDARRGRRTAGRRSTPTRRWPRRSSASPARPTASSRSRGSDARAAGRQAARRPCRGLRGEADHLRRHPGRPRCRSSPRRSGPARRPADGGMPRSPSTSSGSSRSTPSPAGCTSTSTTTGCSTSGRRCRSTGRRSTCTGCSVSRPSDRTARSRSPSATSPRTRSGRSTPSTRTTSSCSRSPAAARRSG